MTSYVTLTFDLFIFKTLVRCDTGYHFVNSGPTDRRQTPSSKEHLD